MSSIYIQHINESIVQIQCEHGILKEFQQLFSFEIEKKRFHPLVKANKWDGVIRLVDSKGIAPKGLVPDFLKYAVDSGYEVQISPEFKKFKEEFSYDESDYGMKFPLYDYQHNAIQRVLDKKRQLIVSPTGSGKSAILAMLMRIINVKTLIIVPNISLLAQLGSDLENYFAASGWDIEEHCYFIGDGIKPQKKHQFIISTWQSLQRLPPEWFEDFESIVVDECIHPDSEIQMSDGTTKKIKDVAVGDFVKTVNESTLELEDKPVVEVFKNMFKSESANRLRITTENGEELIITGNHKVFTQRGWVMADDLTEDDSIQRF